MKRRVKMYILCSVFGIAIIYGGYKMWSIYNEYKIGTETYDGVKEYVNTVSDENVQEEGDDSSFPNVDFKSLKKINSDVVAWIYMEGTNINYPIVQGIDNDYYLEHLIDGNYNKAGSIFLDYRNQIDLNDRNNIIYGHNMANGSMFTDITRYKNQDYYDENSYYMIITQDKNYKIEIFSGYVASVDDDAWKLNFSDDSEFESWIRNTKDKSLFDSSVIPSIEDKIITLSTCSYEFDNARFVLMGILREY